MSSGLTTLAEGENLMSHVLPHRLMQTPLLRIGGYEFYLTNHHLMTIVAAVLVLLVFRHVASRVRTGRGGIEAYTTRGSVANFFETLCVFFREEVARPALGPLTDQYIPYIWTVFFFILFSNLLGIIPFGPILRFVALNNPRFEHWGGTPTGNISITAGLAAVSFFMIHFIGIRHNGWKYFAHFNPGPWYMAPLMVPLEIISSFVKPFALAVRLFANMVAGHLVLAALIGLIFMFKSYFVAAGSIIGATLLSLLELFVAFLQAYIFTFLTVLFIAAGAVHEHEEHETQGHGTLAAEP